MLTRIVSLEGIFLRTQRLAHQHTKDEMAEEEVVMMAAVEVEAFRC